MQGEWSTSWLTKAFKLDLGGNVQQLDQVENTRNFAQNASADQLLPQLQMVVQELKTKFGTWKFLGAILIVFKDCQEILILTMMILLLVCLSAQLWGCCPLTKVFIKKSQRKRYGNSGNSCMLEFGDKVKAKSLLAGEIVVILNQNILMINRKCIKGQFKDVLLQRRCRKNKRKYHPGE
jgi:hypothetical protein